MGNNEQIKIGQYTIVKWVGPTGELNFWIGHESGEGMEVTETVLAELICKFYRENF